MVSPVVNKVFAPQVMDVKVPQVPEKSCKRGFVGAEDKAIVAFVDVAVKLYQTSLRLAVPHPIDEIVVYVAPTRIPAVLTQDALCIIDIAPEQRSFAGAV